MSDAKPTRTEDEYFIKHDAELIKEQRSRLDAERERAERRSHHMKCPKCGADLQETEFHHIKIDKCPECLGTWFDKGEMAMLDHVDQNAIRGFVRSMFGLK